MSRSGVKVPPAGSRPVAPADKSTRPARRRTRRVVRTGLATGFLVAGVVMIPLAFFFYDYNFLLMLPCAIAALVCGFLARRVGAPRLLAYPLMIAALVPIVIGGRVVLELLIHNPVKFHLNGVSWVDE